MSDEFSDKNCDTPMSLDPKQKIHSSAKISSLMLSLILDSEPEMPRKLPLSDRAKSAAQLAVRARAFYDIWWFYEGIDTRPRYANTINTFSEFFRYDIQALKTSMIVSACTLFDKDDQTLGLLHLINEVEQRNGKSARMSAARALLDQGATTVKSLTLLRNNVFAHRSASIRYDEAFRRAAVRPNDIRDLIDASLKIANKILVELNQREVLANRYVMDDTRSMLEKLSNFAED